MAYKIDARQCVVCKSWAAKVARIWVTCALLPKLWYCSSECLEKDQIGPLHKIWRLTMKR
jgi:endonuclease/exonuclease/phosphatase (EEP) superfamily protein YafD